VRTRSRSRDFSVNELTEAAPDHSGLNVISQHLAPGGYEQVFALAQRSLKWHWLLRAKNDASTLEANASMRKLTLGGTRPASGLLPDQLAALRKNIQQPLNGLLFQQDRSLVWYSLLLRDLLSLQSIF